MKRPLLFVCICLTAVIALLTFYFDAPPFCGTFPAEEGESITIVGQIFQKDQRSRYGEEQIYLYLKSIQIIHSDTGLVSKTNPSYKIICELNKEQTEQQFFKLGSFIQVHGKWMLYEHASNPGEFDMADYYFIRNIEGKVVDAIAQKQGEGGWYVRETLYQLRNKLKNRLYQALPKKEASILARMLLGEKEGLDTEIKELYQRNGIVHILSISGLHITIIGMGIYKILRKCSCPIVPSAFVGTVFLLLYGITTGFGISTYRAIGMYLIRMLGEITGRSYDLLTSGGVLMVIMVCSNPRILYHSGFLLSFGSVFAIGCVYPVLPLQNQNLKRNIILYSPILKFMLRRFGGFIKSLWASISISMVTLPIMLFYFYEVPVYAPIVNLFVLPFMSLVMLMGILLSLVPELSVLAGLEYIILSGFEKICLLFEELPGHTWIAGRPQMWQIFVYYILLLVIIWLCNHHSPCYLAGVVLSVIVLSKDFSRQDIIAFLDVGQGDCIVAMAETGKTFLFDGGSSSQNNIGKDVILPFLKYYGISQVDGVFISHPDKDHTNGILQLLSEGLVKIDTVYLPDVDKCCKAEFDAILDSAAKHRVIYYAAGDFLQEEKFRVTCLHPYKGFHGESNMYSGCFLLENPFFQVLLTGDVEGEGELLLMKELQKKEIHNIQVLKAAHHGSKYSTDRLFLDRMRPRLAVISCGKDNLYGHPHEELIQRFQEKEIPFCITYECGCITVTEKGYSFYKR